MFGTEFAAYPEVLVDSFGKMKDEYKERTKKTSFSPFLSKLIGFYISVFGIPEIGFQVRFLHFSHVISQYVKKNSKYILDAGSGIGSYSFFLHKKYPHAIITGGEIDKDKLTFCNQLVKNLSLKNIVFKKMDISKKNVSPNSYDLIVNIDVLEHIKNYKQVLKNFSLLLKPGGYVYIHTPHGNQKRVFSFSEKWHHHDHVREGFILKDFNREIEKNGLKIICSYRTFGPFGRFAWEINHFFLEKSFLFAGLTYPFLYVVSLLDIYFTDSQGWGISILARKTKRNTYEK